MTENTPESGPDTVWSKLLAASTADAVPPPELRDAILQRVAEQHAADVIAKLPEPANDRWFKPWMGMAAAIAVITVVGTANLPFTTADRGAPVTAADAGSQPSKPVVLVLAIGSRGLAAADQAEIAMWAQQPGLCNQPVRVTVRAGNADAAEAAKVQAQIAASAACAVSFDRAVGTNGRIEISAG